METFRIRKLTLIIEIEKNNYNLSYKQLIKDFVYKKLENIIAKTIANCDFNIEGILYIENEIILNLNPIKIENDHNIVYKSIQNSLKEEFQKKIQNIINTKSHEITPLQIYKKNIFINYLKTGIWENNSDKKDINETYQDLLNSPEENIKDIFFSINDDINAIHLFLKTINKELINKTIKILYKKNSQDIINIVDDFIKIKKIICKDFYSEETIKKKTKELLLFNYGEQNFNINNFTVDLIKKINNLHKEKYEKIIYETYHKIKNINKNHRHIFKNNLINKTIENLYIKNFEKIEKQSFYNINDEIRALDIAINEVKINNTNKKIQDLLGEIDLFFSLQFFNKEKIKVILNNKIKNINFRDCDLRILINIFCPHLLKSYLLLRDFFPFKNNETNILTIENFNKRENTVEKYIDSNLNFLPQKDISFIETVKKTILQQKRHDASQEIELLYRRLTQFSLEKNISNTIQVIGLTTVSQEILALTQQKQKKTNLLTHKINIKTEEVKQEEKKIIKEEKNVIKEEKPIAKEEEKTVQKNEKENPKELENETQKNTTIIPIKKENFQETKIKEDSNNKIKEDSHNEIKENSNNKIKEDLNKNNNEQNIEKKEIDQNTEKNNTKDIIQTIVSLILNKKPISQEQKDSLETAEKEEVIATVIKSDKKTIDDLINIFSQISPYKNKKKILIADYFLDSFKYKLDLDFSIKYIINQIILTELIPKQQLFYEIKSIINQHDDKAANLLKKIINTNILINNNSDKKDLYELLLISECEKIYEQNNIFDEKDLTLLNSFLINNFNQPINKINVKIIQEEIPVINNLTLKKNIANIFVENYIRKIKKNFSQIMRFLYLEKFNYISEYYIGELISFLEQIINTDTNNTKINNFLLYCKQELINTLSNQLIIIKINKEQIKKIFNLLPDVKENIKKIEILNNEKIQKKENTFNNIIKEITNNNKISLDILNKFTNQELFSFLEYAYFKLSCRALLKNIFFNKDLQKKYNSIILIFDKLLKNQNINNKKITVIIDYLFIKNHNKKNNIFIYNDIIKIIDFTNIFYGINLMKYFYNFQTTNNTFYKNIKTNNFDKIINLYIDKIATLLKNKNNYTQTIKEIQKIEELIKKSLSYGIKKNINTEKIKKKTEEKKILCDEKTEEICREENIKKIYIRNGGIVIMWPFFYDFFKKQNLLDEYNHSIFKNDISRSNAIHALEFLVYEKYKNPEWKLILNKILCGVDIKKPIYSEYVFHEKNISEKEDEQKINQEVKKNIEILKNNADDSIKKCIEEWKELKSLLAFDEFKKGIDIKTFRNYFLQREGFLNIVEQRYDNGIKYNYILDISNKCYDEYIKNIPWDIQKIELPNMQQPLFIRNFNITHKSDKNEDKPNY